MAKTKFTVDDFNLSTSWTYTPDYEDDAGTRYDLTTRPSSKKKDVTFTITGVSASSINDIVLTWDVSASASGSIATPSTGYGYSNASVYMGASTSGAYAKAGDKVLEELESILTSSNTITCRFYYYPSGLPTTYYDSTKYGAGSCTGAVYFKNITLTVYSGTDHYMPDDDGYGLWVGISNTSRKIKNAYVGVNGVARKVKAAWIGINGVARRFF